MAADDKGSILQFAPFQSAVDEGFWHRLSSLKLNELGIDDSPIPITGLLLLLSFVLSFFCCVILNYYRPAIIFFIGSSFS